MKVTVHTLTGKEVRLDTADVPRDGAVYSRRLEPSGASSQGDRDGDTPKPIPFSNVQVSAGSDPGCTYCEADNTVDDWHHTILKD